MRLMNHQRRLIVTAAALLPSILMPSEGGSAVGWRGDGTGQYPDATPPVTWSRETNVVWKTRLPKWSNASPIVVGDRIFVCAEPASLVCLNAADGRVLWEQTNDYLSLVAPGEIEQARRDEAKAHDLQQRIRKLENGRNDLAAKLKKTPDDAALQEQMEQVKREIEPLRVELKPLERWVLPATHDVNGYTSPTPVSDGKRVFALFSTGIAACYDLEGRRQWAVFLEKPSHGWGHCASPLLAGNRFVVHIRSVFGLDPDSGRTLWQVPAQERFGSPVRACVGGTDLVITAGGDIIRASDGAALARGLHGLAYCAPIVEGGVAYFVEHGGKAVALPAAGNTNSAPAVLWQTRPENDRYYASPVCRDGLIYAITQKQIFSVIDAATGNVIATNALKLGGTAYPSITLAGPYLYVSSDSGITAVLHPGREYREIARNRIEGFRSTPVFHGQRMYIRTLTDLYCIGPQ